MKISAKQVDELGRHAEDRYVAAIVDHAEKFFPTLRAAAGREGLRLAAEAALVSGRSHGFSGQASLRSWYDMTLLLGAEFFDDPLLTFLHRHLDWDEARARLVRPEEGVPVGVVSQTGEPNPIDMLQSLYEDAWDWLDRTAGEDFAAAYRALGRARQALKTAPEEGLLSPAPDDLAALCARVFPERADAAGVQPLADLIEAALARAEADGFSGRGAAIYALWAYLGGIGFYRDPAFSLDGRTAEASCPDGAPDDRAEMLAAATLDYAGRLLDAARESGAAKQAARA